MITKRKLNQKLDLLLQRQALLGTVILCTSLDHKMRKEYIKKFNDLWYEIMGGEE